MATDNSLRSRFNSRQNTVASEVSHHQSPVRTPRKLPRRIDKASIGQPLNPVHVSGSRRTPPFIERAPGFYLPYQAEESREIVPPTVTEALNIDPRNLGQRDEALHSHPPYGWNKQLPEKPPRAGKEINNPNRTFVAYVNEDEDVILEELGHSTDPLLKRRWGHVFSAKDTRLHQFPDPGSYEAEKAKQTPDRPIPEIIVTPPSEGHATRVDPSLLSVNNAFETLHLKSSKENRRLKYRLKKLSHLVPLAWLLSEAEGIDINDTTALVNGLKLIIEDRQKLAGLVPLAATLCEDQGIDLSTVAFGALPQALDKVLNDAKKAKLAAAHHKRARKSHEARLRRLESELSCWNFDVDEEYVY
ncbi:hypothetical protein NUW58_g3922 [Xylaria curta]|uniref:Uncharacterized protein n=1 Tax=Xylaria curta TaxID=42375 RepID=A0ACC1P8P4_9PEZI|nr:hypothetical protein NUW58_g3922 [Xylaria curta]